MVEKAGSVAKNDTLHALQEVEQCLELLVKQPRCKLKYLTVTQQVAFEAMYETSVLVST